MLLQGVIHQAKKHFIAEKNKIRIPAASQNLTVITPEEWNEKYCV